MAGGGGEQSPPGPGGVTCRVLSLLNQGPGRPLFAQLRRRLRAVGGAGLVCQTPWEQPPQSERLAVTTVGVDTAVSRQPIVQEASRKTQAELQSAQWDRVGRQATPTLRVFFSLPIAHGGFPPPFPSHVGPANKIGGQELQGLWNSLPQDTAVDAWPGWLLEAGEADPQSRGHLGVCLACCSGAQITAWGPFQKGVPLGHWLAGGRQTSRCFSWLCPQTRLSSRTVGAAPPPGASGQPHLSSPIPVNIVAQLQPGGASGCQVSPRQRPAPSLSRDGLWMRGVARSSPPPPGFRKHRLPGT